MPSETPPLRVKKPWRMPAARRTGRAVGTGAVPVWSGSWPPCVFAKAISSMRVCNAARNVVRRECGQGLCAMSTRAAEGWQHDARRANRQHLEQCRPSGSRRRRGARHRRGCFRAPPRRLAAPSAPARSRRPMPSRKSPCVVMSAVEAVRPRDRGQGGEIDMAGQVGLARMGERRRRGRCAAPPATCRRSRAPDGRSR